MAQRSKKSEAKIETSLALKELTDYRIATIEGKNVREIVEANTGGAITLQDLTQVTIPAGGSTTFDIANPIGNDEAEKEIEGVLIFWNDRRAYWSVDLDDIDADEGGQVPDCSSADGKTGVGSPGGDCSTCVFAAFGSSRDGGNAQACKSQRLFFLLRPKGIMPLVIRAAPTSIAPSKKYLFGLAAEMVPYWAITTKITLEAQKNGAIKYSTLNFEAGSILTGDDAAMVNAYRNDLLPALEASTINAPARASFSGDSVPVDEGDLVEI